MNFKELHLWSFMNHLPNAKHSAGFVVIWVHNNFNNSSNPIPNGFIYLVIKNLKIPYSLSQYSHSTVHQLWQCHQPWPWLNNHIWQGALDRLAYLVHQCDCQHKENSLAIINVESLYILWLCWTDKKTITYNSWPCTLPPKSINV